MNAMSSPAQSEFYAGVSPVEAPAVSPADLKNDWSPNGRRSLRKRALRTVYSLLITFCIGVAATLAWQSYGDAAREIIANAHPQLGWLVPQGEPVTQNAADTVTVAGPAAPAFDQQQLNAMSTDIETVRQSIDRIVPGIVAGQEQMARSIDRIAATQEKMARTVDQLTASQEQVMREITKLQAVEQYILYKSSEPPPRPAPAPARNPSPRPSLLPIVR
jgi:methyl-accepting chemotaxis protein